MVDFDTLTHEELESLSDDCEDYLLHRNIPLRSHSYVNIIKHAILEGYQLSRYPGVAPKRVAQDP